MIVKEIFVNIRCLEYRQNKADEDYGSCLYARFYFNPDTYELTIISDAGNYAYQWPATPDQKKIASVFKNHIQPVIRKMIKTESEDK